MFRQASTSTPISVSSVVFQLLCPKPAAMHGVVTKLQDPELGLVELCPTGLSPVIQPVQIPALLPTGRSASPANVVSSANLLRVHSMPSTRPSVMILNRTGPDSDPWGKPLVTCHQLALTPFTTTLWASFSRRILWETVSKALLKSR